MILLLLLLYLSYLHVAKNKINTQYRNIDAGAKRKIAPPRLPRRSEQTLRLPRINSDGRFFRFSSFFFAVSEYFLTFAP